MKTIKTLVIFFLIFSIAYFSFFDKTRQYVLFSALLLYSFVSFLWLLKPLVVKLHTLNDLKHANYLTNYNIVKFLFSTFVIVQAFSSIGIISKNLILTFMFLVLKIAVIMIMEIGIFLKLFLNQAQRTVIKSQRGDG